MLSDRRQVEQEAESEHILYLKQHYLPGGRPKDECGTRISGANFLISFY